eukprot:gene9971-11022_t
MESGLIISAIVLIVAICAALAAFGFRGRITTVGIDLGTTFSVVGINKGGEVFIIPDAAGHRIFPSMVSYQDNGEILVAYEALAKQAFSPQNTIYNAKRFIGKSLEEEDTQAYAAEHPFTVVPSRLSNFSKVGFAINASGHPEVVTPEQVGTQVLKFLHKITSAYLGHDQVNKAIIAVPAKFDAQQRAATASIYRAAGLKVMRVIEEPTAAAVAYKLHKKSNVHHILVYDFGGGTLDVSLLFVAQGSVQVYATDGDDLLGGSDVDLCLAKGLQNRLEAVLGYSLPHDNTESTSSSSSAYLCTHSDVLRQAEEIKKALTYSDTVEFSCLRSSSSDENENAHKAVQLTVERVRDLEDGCSELFQRAMIPVQRLLTDLEMSHKEVDEVVLVGGSTRIPRIKQLLREYFGKDLNDHIDPDITVAYGAASIID